MENSLEITGDNFSRRQVFIPQGIDEPNDITLVVDDGKKIKVHRRVLSEASPGCLLYTSILESISCTLDAMTGTIIHGKLSLKYPWRCFQKGPIPRYLVSTGYPTSVFSLGPFIQGKIRRVLHKTRLK